MESVARGKGKKHLHDRIFVKRPTLCCFCIKLRPGVIIITVLLLVAYVSHLPKAATISFGALYVLVIPVAVFGFYTLSKFKENPNLLQTYSRLFWSSVALLILLHLTELIFSFVWRNDIIADCEKDINYLVPSNTSTSTIPYDPHAPDQSVINKACNQGVNLFLLWSSVNFLIFNLLLSIYFGTIVEAYSREQQIDKHEQIDEQIEKQEPIS
ncbi:760_t:CDS:2 [Dentiscutata erythropus]|uniref:760_t:CDS:1 n=1 Tax=Dentiscutata erythropus TaxID=1348616 RepID=A0A9N8ZFG3_9GLOM|nr:760_t:CDS:2 [Dentiscutata erythropus]